MDTVWESELASFLTELSAVQSESLEVLASKREALAAWNLEELASIGKREESLVEKLKRCLRRREELLEKAGREGFPADSIRSLTAALPRENQDQLADQLSQTSGRSRLLQHNSLVNWVVVQRTLIHLSQLLEILATGGQINPTYCREAKTAHSGGLMDRVA